MKTPEELLKAIQKELNELESTARSEMEELQSDDEEYDDMEDFEQEGFARCEGILYACEELRKILKK